MLLPRRADAMPADNPAMPPPTITTSNSFAKVLAPSALCTVVEKWQGRLAYDPDRGLAVFRMSDDPGGCITGIANLVDQFIAVLPCDGNQ